MIRRAASALLLAVALCGCASGSGKPVRTSHVEMPRSYRFDPAVIQVAAGTTVTWHNGDNFTHSVKFAAGVTETLNLAPGQSGTIRFDTPGQLN